MERVVDQCLREVVDDGDGRCRAGGTAASKASATSAAPESAATSVRALAHQDDLAARLIGRQRAGRVALKSTEHSRRRRHRRDIAAASASRHEVDPRLQCQVAGGNRRRRVERTTNHRHILEVAAVVAHWLEPELAKFRLDVVRGFDVTARPSLTAFHRIGCQDVQSCFEIRSGDRCVRRLGRVGSRLRLGILCTSDRSCCSSENDEGSCGEASHG